jgi:hypothetical protein
MAYEILLLVPDLGSEQSRESQQLVPASLVSGYSLTSGLSTSAHLARLKYSFTQQTGAVLASWPKV